MRFLSLLLLFTGKEVRGGGTRTYRRRRLAVNLAPCSCAGSVENGSSLPRRTRRKIRPCLAIHPPCVIEPWLGCAWYGSYGLPPFVGQAPHPAVCERLSVLRLFLAAVCKRFAWYGFYGLPPFVGQAPHPAVCECLSVLWLVVGWHSAGGSLVWLWRAALFPFTGKTHPGSPFLNGQRIFLRYSRAKAVRRA